MTYKSNIQILQAIKSASEKNFNRDVTHDISVICKNHGIGIWIWDKLFQSLKFIYFVIMAYINYEVVNKRNKFHRWLINFIALTIAWSRNPHKCNTIKIITILNLYSTSSRWARASIKGTQNLSARGNSRDQWVQKHRDNERKGNWLHIL